MYRPVRILSLGFRNIPEEQIWDTLRREASYMPDVIVLPEAWLGDDYPMDGCGGVLQRAAEIAAALNTYLICPLYRRTDAGTCRNSAFLLDRQGKLIHTYDKIFPYWTEFSASPPCESGQDTRVIAADFGRIAVTICFDVNFPAVWEKIDGNGAELVLWPSDYSAGRALQAHAMTHHYYIVSATRYPDTAVYDISGDEMSYHTHAGVVAAKTILDLDRTAFHENFNLDKCEKLLAKYPDITVEKRFPREQWFILASHNDRISVKKAAQEFEMEDIRTYIHRSGREINPRFLA
ncbi:MAG: carbon-nitrogen hydrolase family protein [Treponema sp.]|jgi:predicted amidohydrolase|nr:carbon-nitrogen hydrolase family protein [Treponema sp.]